MTKPTPALDPRDLASHRALTRCKGCGALTQSLASDGVRNPRWVAVSEVYRHGGGVTLRAAIVSACPLALHGRDHEGTAVLLRSDEWESGHLLRRP